MSQSKAAQLLDRARKSPVLAQVQESMNESFCYRSGVKMDAQLSITKVTETSADGSSETYTKICITPIIDAVTSPGGYARSASELESMTQSNTIEIRVASELELEDLDGLDATVVTGVG